MRRRRRRKEEGSNGKRRWGKEEKWGEVGRGKRGTGRERETTWMANNKAWITYRIFQLYKEKLNNH